MIKDMAESATLVYPPAAVESEIDGRVESFKQQVTRSGWEWADYLKMQVTTEEALRENFREAAEEVVRQQLILREFVLSEKLSIKEEDVDAKIATRIAAFSDNEMLTNSMRNYYKTGAGFNMISGDILMDKVAERMQAILTGTAPSLEELEAIEAAAEIEADIVAEETAVEIETEVEAETAVETEPEPTTETSAPEDATE
jgi:trigger factor